MLLIDAMGELMHWYQHASLCFVGGTLAAVGGHNPLEPMSVGQPVLFGPHTHNAAALFGEIAKSEAGECVPDAPVGACMVSSEGTCKIWHQYGGVPDLRQPVNEACVRCAPKASTGGVA